MLTQGNKVIAMLVSISCGAKLMKTFVLTTAPGLHAQQSGKIFRVNFLDSSTASGMAVLVDAFRQEMAKLGWVAAKNIAFEFLFSEQNSERLPELAADLVRLKVDLIVVTGGH
jgi:hypothetical protein